MQHIPIKQFLFFSALFILFIPKLYSQNDTLIKYLSSHKWLWQNADSILKSEPYYETSVQDSVLSNALGKDTIYLLKLSFAQYDNISTYLLNKHRYENDSYEMRQYSNDDRTRYETMSKLPCFEFSGNFYPLEIKSGLTISVQPDYNGGISNNSPVAAVVSSLANLQYTQNKKENTLDITYEYDENEKSVKKHFRYRVTVLNAKQIALLPVL